MNKLIYYIFFLILFFIIACNILSIIIACSSGGGGSADDRIPGSGPEDYDVQQLPLQYYGWTDGFTDADKTGESDDKMCWASTAANMLTQAGWAIDEDVIFNMFKKNFANKKDVVFTALNFYFRNQTDHQAEEFVVREYDAKKSLEFIAVSLVSGKAVAIMLSENDQAHVASVYGYDFTSSVQKILYVVSDTDGEDKIVTARLYLNDRNQWEFIRFYRDWHIDYAVSLRGPY